MTDTAILLIITVFILFFGTALLALGENVSPTKQGTRHEDRP